MYMSPELINNRNGAKGYDGRHVDVWASGVLLIVMLLGAFPFDHIEHPDPNTSEAHLEVWCAPVVAAATTLHAGVPKQCCCTLACAVHAHPPAATAYAASCAPCRLRTVCRPCSQGM